MSQNINQLTDDARIVEVVLFIENTSLPLERICALTKLNDEDAIDALRELKDHYLERNSGLLLIEEEGLYSFQPARELYPKLRSTYGRKVDRRLSRAALETLSIVAYSQPITRAEIDKIRGVQSDAIVRLLVLKNSIPSRLNSCFIMPSIIGCSFKTLSGFLIRKTSNSPSLS